MRSEDTISGWLVVGLVDGVVGVRSGDVLVTHSSVVTSVVAGLSLSLPVVVVAMKALGTPVIVAGGVSISVAWFSISLNEGRI